jgi:hypothetical protein
MAGVPPAPNVPSRAGLLSRGECPHHAAVEESCILKDFNVNAFGCPRTVFRVPRGMTPTRAAFSYERKSAALQDFEFQRYGKESYANEESHAH